MKKEQAKTRNLAPGNLSGVPRKDYRNNTFFIFKNGILLH